MAKDILPPTVIEALHAGHKVEAIKRLRAITGQSLKDAKDWVDSYERTHAEPASEPQFGRSQGRDPGAAPTLPPDAIDALKRGKLVEAVKILRAAGFGLAEAKAILDQVQKATPDGARFSAHKPAAHLHVARPGLGPGEVPRGGGSGKWFALIVVGVVAVVAALYFR
jgi:ribosomal protein L7/L12